MNRSDDKFVSLINEDDLSEDINPKLNLCYVDEDSILLQKIKSIDRYKIGAFWFAFTSGYADSIMKMTLSMKGLDLFFDLDAKTIWKFPTNFIIPILPTMGGFFFNYQENLKNFYKLKKNKLNKEYSICQDIRRNFDKNKFIITVSMLAALQEAILVYNTLEEDNGKAGEFLFILLASSAFFQFILLEMNALIKRVETNFDYSSTVKIWLEKSYEKSPYIYYLKSTLLRLTTFLGAFSITAFAYNENSNFFNKILPSGNSKAGSLLAASFAFVYGNSHIALFGYETVEKIIFILNEYSKSKCGFWKNYLKELSWPSYAFLTTAALIGLFAELMTKTTAIAQFFSNKESLNLLDFIKYGSLSFIVNGFQYFLVQTMPVFFNIEKSRTSQSDEYEPRYKILTMKDLLRDSIRVSAYTAIFESLSLNGLSNQINGILNGIINCFGWYLLCWRPIKNYAKDLKEGRIEINNMYNEVISDRNTPSANKSIVRRTDPAYLEALKEYTIAYGSSWQCMAIHISSQFSIALLSAYAIENQHISSMIMTGLLSVSSDYIINKIHKKLYFPKNNNPSISEASSSIQSGSKYFGKQDKSHYRSIDINEVKNLSESDKDEGAGLGQSLPSSRSISFFQIKEEASIEQGSQPQIEESAPARDCWTRMSRPSISCALL